MKAPGREDLPTFCSDHGVGTEPDRAAVGRNETERKRKRTQTKKDTDEKGHKRINDEAP
jgi:hypothetical protein